MTCDCRLWRSIDRLEEVAAELVARGFVGEHDRDDLFAALISIAARWGFQGPRAVQVVTGVAAIAKDERRRIVETYARFSATAASDNERCEKLRALGVSKYQVSRWAAELAPGLLRQLNVPRHRVILELVAERPWMTMAQIVGASGLLRGTTICGLQKLHKRRRLQRRKGRHGVYEYALPDGVLYPEAKAAALEDLQKSRTIRLPRRGRAA